MHKILTLCARTWPLILTIGISFLLRIYKIEELFYFTYDESIPAFVARRLIIWHHIPLIGGVTPFGVHTTPYFYWFLALLLWAGKLNPIIWGYVGAIISTATVSMMYLLGKDIGGKRLAITASILWGFSLLANIYDRHLWALYWGPMLSLLFIYSLHKIIKGSEKFTYVLAFAAIIGISADPSNLIFLALCTLAWRIFKIPVKKSTLIAIAFVILSLLPLVFFDLRHNFANTKPFLLFVEKGSNNPGFGLSDFYQHAMIFPNAFVRLLYTFGDNEIAKQYSYCQTYMAEKYSAIPIYFTVTSAVLIAYFFYWSFKKNKHPVWQLIAILGALYFLGIQIYGTIFKADIFEHYIVGIFPLFLLMAAKLVSNLPRRFWIIVVVLFILLNLQKFSGTRNSHGLKIKREAIEFTTRTVGSEPFSLESHSTCWRLSGYRYLFVVFGKEPIKSYVDPYLGYLYGSTPIGDIHPNLVATFVTHDFTSETEDFYKRYALLKSHEKTGSIFGNIEVIIIDNTTKWFDKEN